MRMMTVAEVTLCTVTPRADVRLVRLIVFRVFAAALAAAVDCTTILAATLRDAAVTFREIWSAVTLLNCDASLVRKASCAVALKEEMSPAIVNVTSTAATSKAPGGRGGGE